MKEDYRRFYYGRCVLAFLRIYGADKTPSVADINPKAFGLSFSEARDVRNRMRAKVQKEEETTK